MDTIIFLILVVGFILAFIYWANKKEESIKLSKPSIPLGDLGCDAPSADELKYGEPVTTSVKDSELVSLKISFSPEEAEIFKMLMDFTFLSVSTVIKDFSLMQRGKSEAKDLYEKFKSTDGYIFLANFFERYGEDYSQEDFIKLNQLLNLKGFTFNEKELESLIQVEKKEREYLNFKNGITKYFPKSFKDYIEIFIKLFYEEISFLLECKKAVEGNGLEYFVNELQIRTKNRLIPFHNAINQLINMATKLYFLKETMLDNKIELKMGNGEEMSNEALLKMVIAAKERYDLEIFEKDLKREKTYSIEDIDSMDGYDFEKFLIKLFEKMGYVVEHTKFSGDQGADLIISRFGETIIVQAKRSNSNVGNRAIQEVVASIKYYKAQKGMVITNRDFTSSALELAESNNVILVNREELIRLIKKHL